MKPTSRTYEWNQGLLPEKHLGGHDLCLMYHDVLAQALVSGARSRVFSVRYTFESLTDKLLWEQEQDPFSWLAKSGRRAEASSFVRTIVLPAVLSDALHCIFEALNCARKAKTTQCFMLLRKPLQESLYLFERMLDNMDDFTRRLIEDPGTLYIGNLGGRNAHEASISRILESQPTKSKLSPDNLYRLRYEKGAMDSFAGAFDKAIHLFTTRRNLQTERLNINFVFSGMDAKDTQWSFIYSRLPYVLDYFYLIVEAVLTKIAETEPTYISFIDRQISANVALWWKNVQSPYDALYLREFAEGRLDELIWNCANAGLQPPNLKDLLKIARFGGFPGESVRTMKKRIASFTQP